MARATEGERLRGEVRRADRELDEARARRTAALRALRALGVCLCTRENAPARLLTSVWHCPKHGRGRGDVDG